MGMKAVSGMFMDWSGIVSVLFRPFLGTSPWVSRAENGPTRDSCLARLTHRLALAGIRNKKKILIHRENLFRPSRGAYSNLENSTEPSGSLTRQIARNNP